jgi:hypothetical protein
MYTFFKLALACSSNISVSSLRTPDIMSVLVGGVPRVAPSDSDALADAVDARETPLFTIVAPLAIMAG